MIERPSYVPFALGDLMMGRAPKEAARGLMGADGVFHEQMREVTPLAPPASQPAVALAPSVAGPAVEAVAGSTGLAASANPRQLITAAMLRQPDATGERLPLLPSSNLSFQDYEDPVPLVKQELAAMGIDHSAFRFRLYDDVISNIGGSYTNRLLEVDMGGGRKEEYAVEWTLRNPRNTANEIHNLMRKPMRNGAPAPW